MKTVRDACELQPGALSIKVSDQIEQLDELIRSEGNGSAFFERTHITQGMQDLITEGLARLAGRSSQAVFHLKQAMGGGKTHLLIGFGLLAKHPHLRTCYASNTDVFGSVDVVAFNGRNNPECFFWGEIARQLGKADRFRSFWTEGPRAPGESDWLQLFEGERPVLILLDEMPPYFQYYTTQQVGAGTVADIVTRAFANLLTAAGKKKNVCIVVSDLTATYDTGGKLIHRALEDARAELGRQERTITPVDLTADEIYAILRKRLFVALPTEQEITQIAEAYGRKLAEATRAKTASRSAEAIADEIRVTYPFHPRLKNLIALFKENEQFKQTRGLLELVSRLLLSVWERPRNDVYLIGAQHFDLSIPEVREKLTEISAMRDVIARDIWDAQQAAHTQVIDARRGSDATAQVAALLLTSSLSTAVNAVRGLTREELVECLVAPGREPSEFLTALEELQKSAWYLHHTPEGRLYFDRQENLTKLLESLATEAPHNQIDELIRSRLRQMFEPKRKIIYNEVLPLPYLDEAAERIRQERVLLIVSPDTKAPSDAIQQFFDGLSQKNNMLVLTGDKTAMASVEQAARHLYAAQKADARIPKEHPQRDDLERKQAAYEQDFTTTILNLFDKVLFPIQRPGYGPQLASKSLDMTRDSTKPFDGEAQIEKTLTSHPIKLYLDVEKDFDAIREKAEDLLWPANQDETRWADVADRYAEQSGMPWLPPRGVDHLRTIAIQRGLWEDLGNGYLTKKPKPKRTAVQVSLTSGPDDQGYVQLRVIPVYGGPAPQVFYAEDSAVSESSPLLTGTELRTNALRVEFLVTDPTGHYETGEPYVWQNTLKVRNRLTEHGGKRVVELFVAPRGEIRYTLDGSEPRHGTLYTEPFEIGDGATLVQVFACADGLETKEQFSFPERGRQGFMIASERPTRLVHRTSMKLDSREKTFNGLQMADERKATFESIVLTVGQNAQCISVTIGEIEVDATFLKCLLTQILEKFAPDAPITLAFKRARFATGHDAEEFARRLDIPLTQENIEQ